MKTRIVNEGGYWSVYVDGVRTVDCESFTIAERVKFYLDNPQAIDYSESFEVAESIRRWAEAAMRSAR